jgi:hypothetical protein
MKKLIIGFILLFAPALTFANDKEYVQDFITKLKSQKNVVFYSECKLTKGKAVLVFPFAEKKGLYIEVLDNSIVNTGDVFLIGGKWRVDELLGGVYSIKRADCIIEELLSFPFKILLPDNVSFILSSIPSQTCSCESK